MQAVEGKKLAESWGATFMESSARENQVRSPLGDRLTVSFFLPWWWGWLESGVFASGLGGVATDLPLNLNLLISCS